MTSAEIRQSFLDFFASKGHTIVPSSSLMPDSPNLLFTNAGMNQFVPIFLGQRAPDVSKWARAIPGKDTRAADTQKCIRAGGKHNDLEDVGLDTYHHTFFEMLGNWSFGDYFKKEAIDWAWELVTEVWKFPKNRLYATVYSPDKTKGDPSDFDQEAYEFWAEKFRSAGLDPKIHIVHGNKNDNFWMMGDTGPCGPCSELHVDLTPAGDTKGSLVNKGDARCIEIWNLVFIQFNANPDGTFSPLPAKHVDTGMGFERVTSIIECTKNFTDFTGVISNYETDIFRPLFDALEKMSGKQYHGTLPPSAGSTGDSPVPPGDPPGGTGSTGDPPVPLGDPPGGTGSTGDPPVPLGDPPSGTEGKSLSQQDAGLQKDATPPSAGLVAQRHGQVAHATQSAPGSIYSKRNLPHFEKPWAIYHVIINPIVPRKLSPPARDIVFDCILHWRERRYQLVVACVMPDHAHFIIQPGVKEEDREGNPIFWPLSEILHSIKSYSAKEVNKLDNVEGSLWQEERYDRYMRGDNDLQEKFHYVCRNPWRAGLVGENEPWPWLWTPEIEAAKPYMGMSERKGSTGDSPIPPGDPPGGTEAKSLAHAGGGLQKDATSPSAGLVAQRHGQVARATQEQIQLDIAFRVIADHIRTLSFAIADGIQPGNTDRNYVLRRILRRAVRYGRTLGFHEPFFYKLVNVLAHTMGHVFREIRVRQDHVEEVIKREEEAFNKTLDEGLVVFEEALRYESFFKAYAQKLAQKLATITSKYGSSKQVPAGFVDAVQDLMDLVPTEFASESWRYSHLKRLLFPVVQLTYILSTLKGRLEDSKGSLDWETNLTRAQSELMGIQNSEVMRADVAFVLFDTYGFPLDLTELMARERGLTVDVAGFNDLMEQQRTRARAAQKKEVVSLSQIETTAPTKFVGFDKLETPAKVLEVVSVKDKTAVVVDTSSFYAEMGGQVGDTGEILSNPVAADVSRLTYPIGADSRPLLQVTNTQKSGGTELHFVVGEKIPAIGDEVILRVNQSRRHAIQRHHTVTHLLHWALHEVVSKEATQKGSFVGPDKLTFDFNSAPLTPAQAADVEKLVNERVLENAPVFWSEFHYNQVKDRKDIMQFFGDKYGDVVRVVQIDGKPAALDGYSMELCGGTHTRATGEIGLFRIVGESAIAAGVRRIEAVAGLEAYARASEELQLIRTLSGKVNAPVAELEKKIESMLAQQKDLEKQLKSAQQKQAADIARSLAAKARTVGATRAIVENLGPADGDFLQSIADALKGQFKGVVVLGGAINGAVSLVATVSPSLVKTFQAGKIIQTIAPIVGGKGGGRPENARGGGKEVGKLDEAMAKALTLLT